MQLTEEIWKPISGPYLDLYEASSYGRIRAAIDIVAEHSSKWCKVGQIRYRKYELLPLFDVTNGYLGVSLYVPKSVRLSTCKSVEYVHRLVYCAFNNLNIADYPASSQLVIDHVDNNHSNNNIGNLQMITHAENCQKSYNNDESSRWSKRLSGVTCIESGVSYSTLKEAVIATGLTDSAIISACKYGGTVNEHHWRYTDEQKHQKCVRQRQQRCSYHHIRPNTNKSNLVRCKETNQIDKASAMARKLGCKSSEVIYNAIDHNHGFSKFLNLHFELIDATVFQAL